MRIKVTQPIVEMTGDEMADVMWGWIKKQLIEPYLDMTCITFDLSMGNRERTLDRVTHEAAAAIREYGVGVKCATITPDEARVAEFGLTRMWKSPNGTIRGLLGGTLFRAPIVCANVPRLVPSWRKPIMVARHAFGDQYAATELQIPRAGVLKLVFEPDDGTRAEEHVIHRFDGPGVALGMFNLEKSIQDFARAVFAYALSVGLPVFFTTKNTILKIYDGQFKRLFAEIFAHEFASQFAARDLTYEHRLIDDMAAYLLKCEGGFVWACMNRDGDVFSDQAAQGYGSLGLMTSVLMCPDGRTVLAEAAHGTVTRHFRAWQRGETISTNPVASIHAWTRGLAHRARLDDTPEVTRFAETFERACIATIESGMMTKDLAIAVHGTSNPSREQWLSTQDFITEVAKRFEADSAT